METLVRNLLSAYLNHYFGPSDTNAEEIEALIGGDTIKLGNAFVWYNHTQRRLCWRIGLGGNVKYVEFVLVPQSM